MARLRFADCEFDTDVGELWCRGEVCEIQPLVVQALALFLSRPNQLVTREELLAELWPDVVVTEQSLTQVVRRLRVAVGDSDRPYRVVQTVHRRGYRLGVEVTEVTSATRPQPTAQATRRAPDLVGRTEELVQLAAWDDAPLVTVLGPGGVGKTALLQTWCAQSAPGAVWVDLASCRSQSAALLAVAGALELVELPDDPDAAIQQLGAALAHRRGVLVLDNAEHLVEDVARVAARWIEQGARLRITSRERLRLRDEHTLDLRPLPTEAATELLVRRARAISAGFTADPEVLAELARRLDGLPLALELAAARTRLLDPQALLDGLQDRFVVLGRGSRDHDSRHSSLQTMVAWSWDLLDATERDGLAALGHVGVPLHLDIAAAVLGSLDLVEALLDKSLVRFVEATPGQRRLGLLETVRAFVVDQRPVSVERQRQFVLATHERVTRLRARGTPHSALLWAELPVLTRALDTCLDQGWATLALQLGGLFDRWTYVRIPHAMYEEVIATVAPLAEADDAEPGPATAVLDAVAGLTYEQHRYDELERVAGLGLQRARAAGDTDAQSNALQLLASAQSHRGELDQARHTLDEAAELATPGSMTELRRFHAEAWLAQRTGRLEEVRPLLRRAVELAPHNEAVRRQRALHDAAVVEVLTGNLAAAAPLLEEATVVADEYGSLADAGIANTRALVLASSGRFDEAVACADSALERSLRQGHEDRNGVSRSNAGLLHLYRGDTDVAERLLQQSSRTRDDNPWTRVGLAVLGLDREPLATADELRRVIPMFPSWAARYAVQLLEAGARAQGGRADEAELLLVPDEDSPRDQLALAPGQLEAMARIAEGWVALARGDLTTARARLDETAPTRERLMVVHWCGERLARRLEG